MATQNAVDNNFPSGLTATGTTTINTTGSATTTIGSSAAGVLALASGSASTITMTNASLTVNTGTGALAISNDASATTVNLATGAGAKLVTLGSTSGASSLALKFGTADFSLASATGNVIVALDTGEVTMPLQSAFLAYNSATDTNQTGNGATATVDFDTVVFDLNSDFAADTFTAPTTGKYLLSTSVVWSAITAATRTLQTLTTSNRNYSSGYESPVACKDGNGLGSCFQAPLCDMDAADTATVTLRNDGEAGNTNSIYGQGGPATYFSGYLAC